MTGKGWFLSLKARYGPMQKQTDFIYALFPRQINYAGPEYVRVRAAGAMSFGRSFSAPPKLALLVFTSLLGHRIM